MKKRRNIDRLINWIFTAELVIGLAIIIGMVCCSCERGKQEQAQSVRNLDSIRKHYRELRQDKELKTLTDSIHEFEDGF